MTSKMKLEFNWLSRQSGSEIDRAFYADIGLVAGDICFTKIEDMEARTVRDHVRGCAFHIAKWFAANWWRLRWEPALINSNGKNDWRMSHTLAAAGGGYVWPDATFTSDGDYLEINAPGRSSHVDYELIHYMDNNIPALITAEEFEQSIDTFMDAIISRLHSLGIHDEGLCDIWSEVRQERNDPEIYSLRKLETMAGFDPSEAPDEFLAQLVEDDCNLGKCAVEEVTADARGKANQLLDSIRELCKTENAAKGGGFRGVLPDCDVSQLELNESGLPWERAEKLAGIARQQWNLGNGGISNSELAGLLSNLGTVFSETHMKGIDIPFAIQAEGENSYDIYLNGRRDSSKRFAACRVIGDHLDFISESKERLLPATRAKTSRQKFQRAFAREFLCPFDALMEKIQTTQPDDDDFEEAAEVFGVSPLMIKTTLVNKHQLDREALEMIG